MNKNSTKGNYTIESRTKEEAICPCGSRRCTERYAQELVKMKGSCARSQRLGIARQAQGLQGARSAQRKHKGTGMEMKLARGGTTVSKPGVASWQKVGAQEAPSSSDPHPLSGRHLPPLPRRLHTRSPSINDGHTCLDTNPATILPRVYSVLKHPASCM